MSDLEYKAWRNKLSESHKGKSNGPRTDEVKKKIKKNKKGYVLICCPDHQVSKGGCVLEHRLVVEKFLGRYLKKSEVVHHVNEIKDDNKIENLMLFKNQKEHASFHTKIKQFGITRPIQRKIDERWNSKI